MMYRTWLPLALIAPLAACSRVDLPDNPIERAALCVAAERMASGWQGAPSAAKPAPFESLNLVGHYHLLAGAGEDGLWDELAPTAVKAEADERAGTLDAETAAATAKQCKRAYPAARAGEPKLPEDDLLALAGCYQLAANMHAFYTEGSGGEAYPQATDVERIQITTQSRYFDHPRASQFTTQEEVEGLMRRGANAVFLAGPPHETLMACDARFATAMG